MGSAGSILRRKLPPAYQDGESFLLFSTENISLNQEMRFSFIFSTENDERGALNTNVCSLESLKSDHDFFQD